MKKIIIIISIFFCIQNAHANKYYLFTDTKTDINGYTIDESITWIFNESESELILITETEDVFFNIYGIEVVDENVMRYILDDATLYINSETLEIIFCTNENQYVFNTYRDDFYKKN
jgi:ABC-type tungstate transport system permease subunit